MFEKFQVVFTISSFVGNPVVYTYTTHTLLYLHTPWHKPMHNVYPDTVYWSTSSLISGSPRDTVIPILSQFTQVFSFICLSPILLFIPPEAISVFDPSFHGLHRHFVNKLWPVLSFHNLLFLRPITLYFKLKIHEKGSF